jgi:tRNA-specific 2-thiouridylase
MSRVLTAKRVNWISIPELREPIRVTAKIRHRHEAAEATVESAGDDQVLVTFDVPQRAITPGQAVVFYQGDVVVGGGWIA